MSTINYTLLTPNDDEVELSQPGIYAYDGGEGNDKLDVYWHYVDGNGMTFSLKQKDGKWVDFAMGQNDSGGLSSKTVTFNAISAAFAASAGEFQYATSANNKVNYKNFEQVAITGTESNDVIVYQNNGANLEYDGGDGIDTFYMDLSGQDVRTYFDKGPGSVSTFGENKRHSRQNSC